MVSREFFILENEQRKFSEFLACAGKIFRNLSMLSGILNYSSTISCSFTMSNANYVLQLPIKESISLILNYLEKIKVSWTGLGKFKHFFVNLGKYKANFTQGQIQWTRIGQGNLNLSLTLYSPVIDRRQQEIKINHTPLWQLLPHSTHYLYTVKVLRQGK